MSMLFKSNRSKDCKKKTTLTNNCNHPNYLKCKQTKLIYEPVTSVFRKPRGAIKSRFSIHLDPLNQNKIPGLNISLSRALAFLSSEDAIPKPVSKKSYSP